MSDNTVLMILAAGLGGDQEEMVKAGLVRAVLHLGQELGLEVIAEGVETVEQFRELAESGCHYGQGYLFDRPLSQADATKLVERSVTSPRLHPYVH